MLVVDDNPDILLSTSALLEVMGHEARVASTGQDCLREIPSFGPDLVLLDIAMPVMSGMEFLRALRQSDLPIRPKVVFCTTENGMGHIRAAIEAGADEYVMKPFDRETLESKLQIVGLA